MKIDRINIFGLYFSNTYLEELINSIRNFHFDLPNYACFPSTDTIGMAYKNKNLQKVINKAYYTLPDGKVTEIYARFKGYKKIRTVSGYWLLKELLNSNLSHYFYGANDVTLKKIEKRLSEEYPTSRILGYSAPPMLNIDEIYPNEDIFRTINEINLLRPDIIWIGISTPKQDFLMNHYINHIEHGLMIGIGAVFLYLAGDVKKSPEWIKQLGLRWLYRLLQEPKRFKHFISSDIFIFLYLVMKEIFYSKLK